MRAAAARAAVALEVAVAAKYALQLAQGAIGGADAAVRVAAWGVAAVVVAATFAPAGRLARTSAWPWAIVAAALAVEATAFLTGVVHGESAQLRYDGQRAAVAVFVAELAVAAACLVAAVRRTTPRARRE